MTTIAVITGAAGGIGAGLARQAVARGMRVVLADRDEEPLAKLALSIGPGAVAVATDVTDPAALDRLADRAFAEGPVALLFNNAGVLSSGNSWEIPAEQWRQAVEVNILGIVNGLRAFVPRLIAAARPARIVNTASVGGFLPTPLMAPYSATKFAVVGLTEALAGELAMLESAVAVSLLAPGPVHTGIFREAPPPSAEGLVRTMRKMLADHGLDADSFAARVFDGIERGDYWIVPQPETFDDPWHARNLAIASRRAPHFYQVDSE